VDHAGEPQGRYWEVLLKELLCVEDVCVCGWRKCVCVEDVYIWSVRGVGVEGVWVWRVYGCGGSVCVDVEVCVRVCVKVYVHTRGSICL